ncbi:armadillo-type protein [Mycena maculata]|uniref:Armadillo-type protein n=1 Tax=Mycena maculata TaxID=230809 RepID=A0AAD7IZM6_9AGAR|nr:armadillo-type protein [Mycena maculata]
MHPLNRGETRTSILSWWSDRNPGLQGPTMNLHAAAKPLMRLMYHRQALNFIEKNRSAPLSREAAELRIHRHEIGNSGEPQKQSNRQKRRCTHNHRRFIPAVSDRSNDGNVELEGPGRGVYAMGRVVERGPGAPEYKPVFGVGVPVTASFEIFHCTQFSSFISHKHAEVIEEATYALSEISRWLDGAQAAVDAKLLDHIEELLISSKEGVQRWTSTLVRNLSRHQSIAQEILTMKPCPQLVSLLRHKNSEVIEQATYALCMISRWLNGAQAVVDAKLLDHIEELLISSNEGVQRWTCNLVGNLATYESIARVVFTMKPCILLVSLLRHKSSEVIEQATYALCMISRWLNGALAVVDAKLLDHIEELLISSNEGVQRWTCNLVGNLASHESIAPHVLTTTPCIRLVSLLRHKNAEIIEQATYALSQISWWLDGALAVVDAKLLDHIEELLISSNEGVQRWTCNLVGNLATYESIARVVLTTRPCILLVSLLRHKNVAIIKHAIRALSGISRRLDGAQAIVDAKLLDHIEELLISSNEGVQRWTCTLVRNLSRHQSIAQETLTMKPCPQLVSLLRHKNSEVIEQATYALCIISWWLDGALAVVDAKLLDHIEELLISSNEGVQRWTCNLVGNLATYESIARVVLTTRPCILLVSLLRHKNAKVIEEATYALSQISWWLDGAQAVTDAKLLDHIEELLISSNEGVQRRTCILVGNLASYKSITPVVLTMKLCILLVSLLRHTNAEVIEQAACALSQICEWLDGAQAAVDAKLLDRIEELLISSNKGVQRWTCILVGNLASYKSIAPAVLTTRPHNYVEVIEQATCALCQISWWLDAAQAAVDAKVLDYIDKLLSSSNPGTQIGACNLIGNLVSHESIAPVVLTMKPCIRLVSLLRHNDVVIHRVAYALAEVSYWPDGAQTAIDAKVMDHVVGLLESPHPGVRSCTSRLVRNLASHDSTATAIAESNLCVPFVSILEMRYTYCVGLAPSESWNVSHERSMGGRGGICEVDVV